MKPNPLVSVILLGIYLHNGNISMEQILGMQVLLNLNDQNYSLKSLGESSHDQPNFTICFVTVIKWTHCLHWLFSAENGNTCGKLAKEQNKTPHCKLWSDEMGHCKQS